MHPPNSPWPVSLDAYAYLRTLHRRDWAWEALRRNAAYRRQAAAAHMQGVVRRSLGNGALLTRLETPQAAAEAWGLCCFRRPESKRAGGAPRVAARM